MAPTPAPPLAPLTTCTFSCAFGEGSWGSESVGSTPLHQHSLGRTVRIGLVYCAALKLAPCCCSESSTMATRGRNVLMTFSMQGWGKLTAAIVNYSLVSTLKVFGGPWVLDGTWRFALAFGCALNILTIYFRWYACPVLLRCLGILFIYCSHCSCQAPRRKRSLLACQGSGAGAAPPPCQYCRCSEGR